MTSASAVEPRTISAGVLGMLLFIASEAMFFAGLFAAYFALRADQAQWPPPGTPASGLGLPVVLTAVLLSSSVTQHIAARGGTSQRKWSTATIALGLVFLTGQAWEWRALGAEGLSVASNVYGTVFFLLTGAHGLHVIGGLVMLGALRFHPAAAGGRGHEARIEAVTYYWHFVDAVWLLVFAALYVSA